MSLFWERVLAGLFLGAGFFHFNIEDIISQNPEKTNINELASVVVVTIGNNIEQIVVHFRIQKNGPPKMSLLEIPYNVEPSAIQFREDVRNCEENLQSIRDKLSSIFSYFP